MPDGPQAKRRPGRPALPPEKGKRYAIGVRTTKELKGSLQRAADSSGRSLAQEIEFRLERSVDREGALLSNQPELQGALQHLQLILPSRSSDFYEGLLIGLVLGATEIAVLHGVAPPTLAETADRSVALGAAEVEQAAAKAHQIMAASGAEIGSALSVQDVAKRYKCSRSRVYGWIRLGELVAIRQADGRYQITPDQLADFERRCIERNDNRQRYRRAANVAKRISSKAA